MPDPGDPILLTPPNPAANPSGSGELLRIDEVWAFVSVDADGNEGVCAMTIPGLGFSPLIAADKARLKSLWPMARQVAQASKMRVRLIRLSTREDVAVIGPDGKTE